MRATLGTRGISALKPTINLTDRLTGSLRDEILSGQYQVGELLPSEQEMANTFGVSRTVVREAVSRLKAEGLLTARQGLGVLVMTTKVPTVLQFKPVDLADTNQIVRFMELRLGIEAEAVSLAAQRRTDDQLVEFKAALDQMEAALRISDADAAIEADVRFHKLICMATDNPFFVSFIVFLENVLRDNISTSRQRSVMLSRSRAAQDEHVEIYEAIRARDPKRAREALRAHVENAVRRFVDSAALDFSVQ